MADDVNYALAVAAVVQYFVRPVLFARKNVENTG